MDPHSQPPPLPNIDQPHPPLLAPFILAQMMRSLALPLRSTRPPRHHHLRTSRPGAPHPPRLGSLQPTPTPSTSKPIVLRSRRSPRRTSAPWRTLARCGTALPSDHPHSLFPFLSSSPSRPLNKHDPLNTHVPHNYMFIFFLICLGWSWFVVRLDALDYGTSTSTCSQS